DIVRNLRDFARLDEADFKEADFNAALDSAAEILGHEIRQKEVRLEKDYRPLPPVLCHPGKVNQVLLNLLANAVQACDRGGRVVMRTRFDPSPQPLSPEGRGAPSAPLSPGGSGVGGEGVVVVAVEDN